MEKYEKVLELMKAKGGKVSVDDAELAVLLERETPEETFKEGDARRTSLLYRLPTYISFIRKYAKLEINGIRTGRKVVAYELAALATAEPIEDVEETPAAV
jgi:hypothetical protein